MFPRPLRLTDPKLFALLFRQGLWQRGRNFSVRYAPARGSQGLITFVISKKVTKRATERNRNKRRLRTAFHNLMTDDRYKEVFKKYHVLVIVHRSIENTPYPEIAQEAESIVAGLGTKASA